MLVVRDIKELDNLKDRLSESKRTIGFIPTMGALHQGHLSLLESSLKENDFSIVSIFVNPTQFNNSEDLRKYPRTEEKDLQILEAAGCDAVFIPDSKTMYPDGEKSEEFDFDGLEFQMEGSFRPGHFDGVGTIVKKLFELVGADRAYFGEKDFQQLRIIQKLTEKEKLTTVIAPVPIKREKDGLAMSSRNLRLTDEMRREAPVIYKILKKSREYLETHTIKETKEFAEKLFENTKLKLEYFEISDEKRLTPAVRKSKNNKLRAFVACYANDIRLIDNLSLN